MAQGSAGRGAVKTKKELCLFISLGPFLALFAAE